MQIRYVIAALFLFAALAFSAPMYEAPEWNPKPITIGQSDEERRQSLYDQDVQEFGETKARTMLRTREKADSLIAFPQRN